MLSDVTLLLIVERVGIRNALKLQKRLDEVQASHALAGSSSYPIVTPWASNDLQRIVFEDIFGTDVPMNTRESAMRLPGIARGRNMLVATIARQPLVELQGQDPVEDQPAWITQTGDGSSPQLRLAYTVDDLIFYGWSCWWRHRQDGAEVARSRINQGDWQINDDMRVEVNGHVVANDDVLLIPGFHEGILTFGVDVIEDGRLLYKMVRARLLNPTPQLDLHQTEGADLTDDEIDALITRWAAARQGKNGGVSYTSKHIEVNELGAGDAQLMIEARNASAVDQARLIGVHAGQIDATAPKASLNYETQTGRNQEFVDYDLALYMAPIAARLSQDDVCEPGRRIDFDLTAFTAPTPSVTGPNLED